MPSTGDIVRASDFEAIKPQLNIGTVTTGAAGSNASASITGTSPNFKLNLTIPRGNTGATGATGPQGPSGTATVTLKGTRSTAGNWSITGLAVRKPLYIILSCPTPTNAAYVLLLVTSGTNDTSVVSDDRNFMLGVANTSEFQKGNSCIVIPTSSTVVVNIRNATSATVLRAYQ